MQVARMEWEEASMPLSLSWLPGRGASAYLLLLEVQQICRAHLAVAVCAGRRVPAHAASSSDCSPGPAATAAISLSREAAHAVLTRRS